MFNFATKLVCVLLWFYCLYQDIVTRSVWWFLGDFFFAPMGIIRGLLKIFGII